MIYFPAIKMSKEAIEQNLGLKTTFWQTVRNKTRHFISRLAPPIKKKSYLSNSLIWLFIFLIALNVLLQNELIRSNLSLFPQKVPLLTFYISLEKRLLPTELVVYIPFLSIIIATTSLFIAGAGYKRFKNLSIIMTFFTTASIAVITMATIKLVAAYI